MKNKIKEEIKDGLIVGLIGGLTITFTTQLIALISQNPEFVMNDLISSGLLIIIIQSIGWLIIKNLAHKKT